MDAVLLPEVFLKALTVVRNLGHVVQRPTLVGGKGFNVTGHHELMIPLLAAAIVDRLGKI